jgi:hypothetical protein
MRMLDRSRKKPKSKDKVSEALEKLAGERSSATKAEDTAKLAASLLGRLGGLKGGKARAKKLSAKRRNEIARKAAAARWKGHDN